MRKPVSAVAAGLLALGLASPAVAGSGDAVVGAVVGAGFGAAIGHSIDGRQGALLGSAIGAVAGTAIATDTDRRDRDGHYHSRDYRDVRYVQPEYRYVEPVHYRPAPPVVYQPVYVTPAYYPAGYYAPRAVKVKYRYYDDDYRHGRGHWKHRHGHDDRRWRHGRDRDWD